MADPIVGIDLGTSNTVVAHTDDTGVARVLADEGGAKIHPSVVSFHPNGGVVVGAAAKQRKVIDPKNTIYSVKRLIGRTYNAPEVQIAKKRMPFQIKEGPNQQPLVVTRGGEFAVPEVSAIVLDYVRNLAAAQLGMPVQRAVVTVPASFNDAQRSATATAGAIAGLTIVRVLNEPTAAALAYGNTRNLNEVIAVFDFGGGTFDITILKLRNQVYEVLGTAGDTFLGGDDLDERLVDRMVEKFLAENRIDLRTNEVSMMRLRAVAEQTKIELSRRSRAVVRIDEIAYGPRGKPLDLQIEIKRDEFVGQVADLIDRTFPVCQEALSFAGLSVDKIDDVILVGGTTKIPYVRDQVAKFFARAPRTDINPEDAVALGAGLQASSLERILKKPGRTTGSQPVVKQAPDELDDFNTTATQTSFEPDPDTYTDAAVTTPATDYPIRQIPVEEDSILSLLPPQEPVRTARQTAGYEQQTHTPTSPEPTHDRPAAPGKHHDRLGGFEERTPAQAAPIGRMTKAGMPTVRASTAPVMPVAPPAPPIAPPQKVTQPKFTSSQPITQPRGSANAGTDQQPVRPPPSPPPRAPTAGMGVPVLPTAPITQPRVEAARPPADLPQTLPPQARTMIVEPAPFSTEPITRPAMPQIASHAATMMLEPESELELETNPAATSRGFPPPPSAADTSPMSPASTAPGFAPPQSFPINAPAMAMMPAPNPVVLDVTPRGLGIGTVAGYCEELIRRNARVPTEIRKLFTTSRDDQDTVRIIVCQGESRRLDSNVVLGDLMLQGLPPRPRGETSIEVTFQLDASGILQVRARDAQTGREQRASLDLAGAMPQAEVQASRERMQALRR